MKNLSRILSMLLLFSPLCVNAAGTVATTAGANLTAFNPSNANNNQWAMMSNGRYDGNSASAKVDFGNCNAVVLRCAQPKCANGGCSDMSIASAIVAGCVQSNDNCKQYGNDLVQYMSAQLVASSTAKVNEQNAAAQQAAAQQSQQQMAQMQQQMQQMQYQMQQQQAESAQQLQAALAQQAAQNQAAIENMKSAATAAAMENEAGISAYQQDAINRGISADVLERQKITGQVMSKLENADVSLKEVKIAMNTAFEYAGCDTRGSNCTGPKRIKKWRELATEFFVPYDNTIDNVYDALIIAQSVGGIDLSDIYMMLNDSCNSWGQYMCPKTQSGYAVRYGEKQAPRVCPSDKGYSCNADGKCEWDISCQPCTLLKVLTSQEDVYDGWINADDDVSSGNVTVVACASGALDSSALFVRRTKNKNGAGLVDIDKLDTWINQTEPGKQYKNSTAPKEYCQIADETQKGYLERSMLSKVVPAKGAALCVEAAGSKKKDDTCPFISNIYAICDVHQYNAGIDELSTKTETPAEAEKRCKEECEKDDSCKNNANKEVLISQCTSNPKKNKVDSAQTGEMKEIVAMKTTVFSQQMYKQYEYLSATLRRLKTQLEKATLTAQLQAAGAKSDESSSGLLGGGSSAGSQYRDCTGKNKQGTVDCLRENYAILSGLVNNKKCDKKCKNQIQTELGIMNSMLGSATKSCTKKENGKDVAMTDKECLQVLNGGYADIDSIILKEESDRRGYGLR